MKKGTPTAPSWISVFDASEDWKIPPWDIAPGTGKVIWWLRYEVYRREKIKAQEDARKKQQGRK